MDCTKCWLVFVPYQNFDIVFVPYHLPSVEVASCQKYQSEFYCTSKLTRPQGKNDLARIQVAPHQHRRFRGEAHRTLL
jgi:hypothetical protein